MKTSGLVFVLAMLFAFSGCGNNDSVEQQIIDTIHEMEELAENGQRRPFMRFIHEDFQGRGGSMNREDFNGFMIIQWNQYRRLSAQLFPIQVTELSAARADATFRVLVTGGQGLIPENGQLFQVSTTWLKEGSDWQLWRANWERAL